MNQYPKRTFVLALAAAAALVACGGGGGGGPAAPPAAALLISSVQDLGGGRLGVTVTNASGQAVLNLDRSNFEFGDGAQTLGLTSVTLTNVAAETTVAVALDASGSMATPLPPTCVGDYPVCKTTFTYAAQATHALLDGMTTAGVDEAGIVLFASTVFTMNDATFAALPFQPLWVTPAGVATSPYSFSATGLTKQFSQLRPVVDLYNRYSDIYLDFSPQGDDIHPDTETSSVRLSTPYASDAQIALEGTRLFDGISAALSLLANADVANERKIVIALTDGRDDNPGLSAPVIAQARAAGVPLYLIGFANADIDEPTMQSMADQTGGQYRKTTTGDLTGLFSSILADLSTQYIAVLAAPPAAGSTVTVRVTQNGTTVTRNLPILP